MINWQFIEATHRCNSVQGICVNFFFNVEFSNRDVEEVGNHTYDGAIMHTCNACITARWCAAAQWKLQGSEDTHRISCLCKSFCVKESYNIGGYFAERDMKERHPMGFRLLVSSIQQHDQCVCVRVRVWVCVRAFVCMYTCTCIHKNICRTSFCVFVSLCV